MLDRARLPLRIVATALVLAGLGFARAARARPPAVLHLTIQGVINPIEARYVKRSLEQARADGFELVLVSIDTPGGLVTSMEEIVRAITNSEVPVAGLVEPRTAQATSAGAYILLSMDVAGMAPETRFGAAHPVGAGGEALKGPLNEKATNSLVALAKSLLGRHDRPEALADSIVRESKSYTAEEALKEHAIDFVAADSNAFLADLDGYRVSAGDRRVTLKTKGARLVEGPMSVVNRILDALADPTIASLLCTIGFLGILYELSAPGIGLGGIVGVASLLLGLLSMSVLPVNLGGILLITAGVVAIGLEARMPTHGLLGFGGAAAVLVGALVLVDEARYFGAAQHVNLAVLIPVVLIVGGLFLILAAVAARALRAPPQSGLEALPGARAVVRDALVPSRGRFEGMVFVDGARWAAVSAVPAEEGTEVVIVAVHLHPTRLEVKPIVKGAV